METLALPHALALSIRRAAQASPDEEVCGLIARDTSGSLRCQPMANGARDKAHAFEMDAREQIDALRGMRERGEQLMAIYHSHPNGPAQPSRTDIERHEYPDALCLIVSLANRQPELRAFRIGAGIVSEVSIVIGPPAAA